MDPAYFIKVFKRQFGVTRRNIETSIKQHIEVVQKSAFDYESCLTASSASNMEFSRNVRCSRSFLRSATPFLALSHLLGTENRSFELSLIESYRN